MNKLDVKQSLNRVFKEKQAMIMVGLTTLVVVLGLVLYSLQTRAPNVDSKKTATQFVDPVTNGSESVWREQQEIKLAKAVHSAQRLANTVAALQSTQQQQANLIQAQTAQLQALQLQQQTTHTTDNATAAPGVYDGAEDETNQAGAPRPTPHIAITQIPLTPNANSTDIYTTKNYLPAGSFIRAVLLSGLDAPTGLDNQSQPIPVLLRLTSWGNLPNDATSHIKSCFMTAAGIGDISASRAYIRTEHMSCTLTNGHIIDVPVDATVVGPDGKAGVRGPLVWGETAMTERAAAAGLLSGFSNAISQAYTTQSVSPLGSTTTVNNQQILQYGAASGVASGMNQLAEYYIKRAEEYQPVVEISAGTSVDVMLLQGFGLPTTQGSGQVGESNNGDMTVFGG